MTQDTFAGLEPRSLWQHFAAFTRIPRPSGREQQAADYVQRWAANRGYPVKTDAVGNLCVQVPGTPGREAAPAVVLQGHLDMVCERNAASPYDPEKGNICVVRDGDWIRSEGTTLGADDGIGVASAMAVAEEASMAHGPLDLLFTVDEEVGMSGASGLDPAILRGRILLNLDSEDDGILFVGCAGGGDLRLTFEAPRQPAPAGHATVTLSITGLRGGHSGGDIHLNRLNAVHALVRVVQDGLAGEPAWLVSVDGGSKRNAIPREAQATLSLPETALEGFRARVEQGQAALRFQYKGLEEGLEVKVEEAPAAEGWAPADSARLLDLLRAIPSGVVAMSQDIPGLVETSTNLGVATTDKDAVTVQILARSSVMPALADLLEAHKALARLAGVKVEYLGGYPGWKPDMSSRVLAVTRAAYERLFGQPPQVTAVHAGLECGIIGERVAGMDMVSFGPQVTGAHAPGERVSVESTERFWRLLAAVLDDLSR